MIKHKVFWSFVSHDNESEVTYYKTFELPFVLSVGQSVSALECCPIKVVSVEIELDSGDVDVQLKDWKTNESQEAWTNIHNRFANGGWHWLDGSGQGDLTALAKSKPPANPQPASVDQRGN